MDLKGLVMQNPDQKIFLIIVGSTNKNPSGKIGHWIAAHAELVERDQELYLYRIHS
jgi:hypothetical protein